MLVSCFRGHTFMVYLRTLKVHNNSPLPFGNPKSRPWYSMDIFWNRPIRTEVKCFCIYKQIKVGDELELWIASLTTCNFITV